MCTVALYIAPMILVGLTGGIVSGKSTVSKMLTARGAEVIDADMVTRDVQRPGSPVIEQIVERFGSSVVDSDGALIRPALAEIVFSDADALRDLNKIVHPAVAKEMSRRVEEARTTEKIVVLDIPLLTENPRKGLQGKIVVDAPTEVQVERLVRHRGFGEADVRARIGRQATREERLKDADFVVDNSGEMEDLEPQIDRLWEWLTSLPQLPPDHDIEPG